MNQAGTVPQQLVCVQFVICQDARCYATAVLFTLHSQTHCFVAAAVLCEVLLLPPLSNTNVTAIATATRLIL